jgi:insecticidal toxin
MPGSDLDRDQGRVENPVTAVVQARRVGHAYQVQFIDVEDPSQTRWISANDEETRQFRSIMDEKFKRMVRGFEYGQGSLVCRNNALDAEAVDGLNAMFVVKTFIEELSQETTVGLPGGGSTLAMALQVHSYWNMAQLGHGVLQDATEVVQLARSLVESEKTAQKTLTGFMRALGRGLGTASKAPRR